MREGGVVHVATSGGPELRNQRQLSRDARVGRHAYVVACALEDRNSFVGFFTLSRQEVRLYAREIELVRNFAAQA